MEDGPIVHVQYFKVNVPFDKDFKIEFIIMSIERMMGKLHEEAKFIYMHPKVKYDMMRLFDNMKMFPYYRVLPERIFDLEIKVDATMPENILEVRSATKEVII